MALGRRSSRRTTGGADGGARRRFGETGGTGATGGARRSTRRVSKSADGAAPAPKSAPGTQRMKRRSSAAQTKPSAATPRRRTTGAQAAPAPATQRRSSGKQIQRKRSTGAQTQPSSPQVAGGPSGKDRVAALAAAEKRLREKAQAKLDKRSVLSSSATRKAVPKAEPEPVSSAGSPGVSKKAGLAFAAMAVLALGYLGGTTLRGMANAAPADEATSPESGSTDNPLVTDAQAEPIESNIIPGTMLEWWDVSKVAKREKERDKLSRLPDRPDRAPDAIFGNRQVGFSAGKGTPPGAPGKQVYARVTGQLKVPADGMYTFWTVSDDGSKLKINDVLVVDNDGMRRRTETFWGEVELKKGLASLEVEYFTRGDSESSLRIFWRHQDDELDDRKPLGVKDVTHLKADGEKFPEPKPEKKKDEKKK